MKFLVRETLVYEIGEVEDGASAIATRKAGGGLLMREHASYVVTQCNGGSSGPVPYKDWPMWAKILSKFAKDGDKGIGDVVLRQIGSENSDQFKAWYKKTTGKDCGCTGRQARWNREFPLPI